MRLDKRVLVTGGAGFIGSHPGARLLESGRRRPVRRQLLYRLTRTTSRTCWASGLRADAPRRDVSALCRGRPDLQPGPACPRALSARPGADHQDQRPRRHQHAGPGQARCGATHPAGLDQRGLWRSRRSTRRPRIIGATSTRSASRSCYDEGKRCAETLFFDYHRQHKPRDQGRCASSTPTAPACTRTTGGWCPTSSSRPCAASRSPSTATAARPAASAMSTT